MNIFRVPLFCLLQSLCMLILSFQNFFFRNLGTYWLFSSVSQFLKLIFILFNSISFGNTPATTRCSWSPEELGIWSSPTHQLLHRNCHNILHLNGPFLFRRIHLKYHLIQKVFKHADICVMVTCIVPCLINWFSIII